MAEAIKANRARGKNFAIVVVAEGTKPLGGDVVVSKVVEDSPDPIRLGGIGEGISEQLERLAGLESRATILGHVQGEAAPPQPTTGFCLPAMAPMRWNCSCRAEFGNMVTLNGSELSYDSLENANRQEQGR